MSLPPPPPDEIAYFEQIETRFAQLRGTPLLLSPKDWALVAAWHGQGIPLWIVLSTLESIFDSRKSTDDGTTARAVVSLGYCRHAVEEAFSDWQESRLGAHETEAGGETAFGPEQAAKCLQSWKDEMDRAAKQSELDPAALGEATTVLEQLAEELLRSGTPSLAMLEERLEELEDELLDRLFDAAKPDLREKIEAHVNRSLMPLRDRLTARAYDSTQRSHLRAQVRQAYGLPRLTLYQI